MSDSLIISGNGSLAVATDALFALLARLEHAESGLSDACRRAAGIDQLMSSSHARYRSLPARQADVEIHHSVAALITAQSQARLLIDGLRAAIDAYGVLDESANRIMSQLAARGAMGAGFVLPALIMLFLPALAGVAAAISVVGATTPGGLPAVGERVRLWLHENNELLSNPLTVEMLRLAVMSTDDAINGAFRLPPELSFLLGDDGFGVTGLDTAAATIVAVASRFGMLREGPVAVVAGPSALREAQSPSGFAQRADRLPSGDSDIRIERYIMAGRPDRFEVYIGGTKDFSLVPRDDALDMTSNVSAIAGISSGAERATLEAMRQAGIQSTSEVVFTGYSQGGLIATSLAASGMVVTRGLITFGAPAGQIAVPGGFPAVVVEHAEDIVPAVGGSRVDSGPVLVSRHLFADGDIPTDYAVPAHQLVYYRETAALMDLAESPELTVPRAKLNGFAAGAEMVEITNYSAQRERVAELP